MCVRASTLDNGTFIFNRSGVVVRGQYARVGVGVMIIKDGRVLLGKRKGAHGAGEYAFPGGHLEHMESVEECVLRELAEECGVMVASLRFQCCSNTFAYRPRHYVHIGMIADWHSGEPRVLEPEKCEFWAWYLLNDLPSPLFELTQNGIESYRTGRIFFDSVRAKPSQ